MAENSRGLHEPKMRVRAECGKTWAGDGRHKIELVGAAALTFSRPALA